MPKALIAGSQVMRSTASAVDSQDQLVAGAIELGSKLLALLDQSLRSLITSLKRIHIPCEVLTKPERQ